MGFTSERALIGEALRVVNLCWVVAWRAMWERVLDPCAGCGYERASARLVPFV
jgi:hypothetical protein